MARMYSRKKGKSGSTKPLEKSVPEWIKYKPAEIEAVIGKLGKEGKTASEIGIILRDQYGIPDVKTLSGKTITDIMQEKGIKKELPEDLMALVRKAIYVRKHLEENKQDQPAKRGLRLTESKILRLARYYKESGKLPSGWKYQPDKIKILVE